MVRCRWQAVLLVLATVVVASACTSAGQDARVTPTPQPPPAAVNASTPTAPPASEPMTATPVAVATATAALIPIPSPSPEPTPPPIATPTPTVAWADHTDPTLGISFRHPADWYVQDSDPTVPLLIQNYQEISILPPQPGQVRIIVYQRGGSAAPAAGDAFNVGSDVYPGTIVKKAPTDATNTQQLDIWYTAVGQQWEITVEVGEPAPEPLLSTAYDVIASIHHEEVPVTPVG